MAEARSSVLRSRAVAFCAAFLDPTSNPPSNLIETHFMPTEPKITEHGPSWATSRLPFLGKTFQGRKSSSADGSSCDDYFDLLAQSLSFHPNKNTFPPAEDFIVDPQAGVSGEGQQARRGGGAVSVVAHAKFASVKTGKSWEEDFIYRLSEFDDDGRIGHWEIWADPLSAWMAVEEP
ncbi:MAG: hypothetical protein M4579_002808 [Chaenotheca gracillima]|nr:MAG: hypothetical protein M4579_002808 [Chaenotheca gracillima]